MNDISNEIKQKHLIKQIIAEIMFIDDIDTIQDQTSIFQELNLSSIDYIDLCFVLKKKFSTNIDPDFLWPINKMCNNPKLFSKNQWTEAGWKEVCKILNINDIPTESLIDLHKRFTVSYILHRINSLPAITGV